MPKRRSCPTRSIGGSARSRRRSTSSRSGRSRSIPTRSRVPAPSSASRPADVCTSSAAIVRPEDERAIEPAADEVGGESDGDPLVYVDTDSDLRDGASPAPVDEPEEDDGLRPIPDRLLTELTAHRTLALRHALGDDPDVAFVAALHALCLQALLPLRPRHLPRARPQERRLRRAGAGAQRQRVGRRRSTPGTRPGGSRCRRRPSELWDALAGVRRRPPRRPCSPTASRCRSTPCSKPYDRRPRALAHADQLASAVELDMATAGWTPTVGELSRPRHQGAHPRRGARGEGRAGGAAASIT